MVQAVRATDEYGSQLFQWNAAEKVISLPHGNEIWYARLQQDGQFVVIDHKPKAQMKSPK